ncbi:hypothetical protein SAMN02745213_01775 [Succinivibrio dextrinosolvens DSM 3072]|uniref:Lipoprotein n=1 Tax=Succinivibrio dextrinosolvens DSM 3072 TaxID=1123324 RepID=A0A1T4VMI8_9GAMM|nr:hypothetical protein [Succinivibrio dextrinosolvens]SKA66202.1 hypothetical protein SAMN02745213_01775 [Succinivibrio dextrinosolvens DSM 3072]
MKEIVTNIIILLSLSSLSGCSYIYSLLHRNDTTKENSSNDEGYYDFVKEQMKKEIKPFQKLYEQGDIVKNDKYRLVIPKGFIAIDNEDINALIAQAPGKSITVSIQTYDAKREGEIGCDSVVDFYKKDPTSGFYKAPYFIKTRKGSGCELFLQRHIENNVKYGLFTFTKRFDDSKQFYEVSSSISSSVSYEDYIALIKDFFKTAQSSEVQQVLKYMVKEYDNDDKILKEKQYDVTLTK